MSQLDRLAIPRLLFICKEPDDMPHVAVTEKEVLL